MTLLEKLQQLLSENASAEQIQSSLGEFMIPKGTFNEVNNKAKAYELENAQLKSTLQGKDQELESIKTANMTEQELLQHKLARYETQIKDHTLKTNRVNAGAKFAEAGFTKEEYEKLLDKIVNEDEARTMELVDSFIGLTASRVDVAKQATKNELLDGAVEVPNGETTNSEELDDDLSWFNADL